MKAAVLEQMRRPMVIKEVPDPWPEAGEVLIRVHAAGVCHTDLHIAAGDFDSLGLDPTPLILGHEITGVVEQPGDDVTEFKPGDHVGVHWIMACGKCPFCLMGEEESCLEYLQTFKAVGMTIDGGYAEYVKVPAARIVPLPEELDPIEAAPLFCAGVTVYAAMKNAGLQQGMRVAVLGIGGLGHLAIPIARAMGADVIAITSTESKRQQARHLGAVDAISGPVDEWGQKLIGLGGANIVLSTTVDFKVIGPVMQGLLPQGALVITGSSMEPMSIIPSLFITPQHRMIGSLAGSRQDQRELLQMAVDCSIRPMIEVYTLEDANLVHERVRANQVRFRAVLSLN